MIGQIAQWVRGTLQKKGWDLIRFRSLNTILSHHGVDLVLDVGGNVGQYGTKLRGIGYRGRIVSFEPQAGPFKALSEAARQDGNWTAVHLGLGGADSQQQINVYTDSALSSLLKLDQKTYIFDSQQAGTETIEVRTLDGLFDQYVRPGERVLLKIDTQGFEKEVLRGAEASFARLTGIQIEMSLTPIYAEQPHLDEMIALLRGKGFMLWQIQRGICKMETGQEMEADGIFIRQDLAQAAQN